MALQLARIGFSIGSFLFQGTVSFISLGQKGIFPQCVAKEIYRFAH